MSRHKRRKSTARPPQREGSSRSEREADDGPGDRLQKVLAAAGVGSRRDCEELIREGRIEVDRAVVTEMGTRVDPTRQEIRVDGQALRQPKRLYYAVNKPVGVVTTNYDPSGRPRVIDLVPTDERVFAVGRLDRASEGLILVTNDGEFANRITHPRYGVEKTYLARVAGQPTSEDLARLKKGVHLSDGYCRVQSIVTKKRQGQSTDLVMVLNEGRNREIRRVLARVGHKVLRLKRIAVGSIRLADQPVGAWRRLMPGEIESLLSLAKEKRRAAKTRKKPPARPGGMKPALGERGDSPYLQQQALMAEPLSLEDLLKDDLGDGGVMDTGRAGGATLGELSEANFTGSDEELNFSEQGEPAKRGGVLQYEPDDEVAAPAAVPTPARREPRAVKPQAKQPAKKFARPGGKKFDKTAAAGERSVGDKRPGGKKSGPKKFGAKKFGPKKFGASQPDGERPRAQRPETKKFAKPGGKKFAKAGAKAGGKPGGKPAGKPFAKKFGKPGGKRKGSR